MLIDNRTTSIFSLTFEVVYDYQTIRAFELYVFWLYVLLKEHSFCEYISLEVALEWFLFLQKVFSYHIVTFSFTSFRATRSTAFATAA